MQVINYYKIAYGCKGNAIFLRYGEKPVIAKNIKYEDAVKLRENHRFLISRVIKEDKGYILAELTVVQKPPEIMPKVLARAYFKCKKCDIRAHLVVLESQKKPLDNMLHVYDVWFYTFKWSNCSSNEKAEAWIDNGCPHMVPYFHSYLISHGFPELAQALVRDYLGENVLQYFQGWKVMPVLSAQAAYEFGLGVNESYARAKAEEAFDEAWKCWEGLSKEFSELGRSTLQMLLEGVREKCVEIVEEVKE